MPAANAGTDDPTQAQATRQRAAHNRKTPFREPAGKPRLPIAREKPSLLPENPWFRLAARWSRPTSRASQRLVRRSYMGWKIKGGGDRPRPPRLSTFAGRLVSHRLDGTPHDTSAEDDGTDRDTGGHAGGRITGNAGNGSGDVRGRSHGRDGGSSEHGAREEQFLFHVVFVSPWLREPPGRSIPNTGRNSQLQLATAFTAAHTHAAPRGRSQTPRAPQSAMLKISQSIFCER